MIHCNQYTLYLVSSTLVTQCCAIGHGRSGPREKLPSRMISVNVKVNSNNLDVTQPRVHLSSYFSLACGCEDAAVAGAAGDPPAVGVEQHVGRELAGDQQAEIMMQFNKGPSKCTFTFTSHAP